MSTPSPAAIDTHAHVYPAAFLDHLESIGTDPATTRVARDMRASNEPDEIAARLSMMDKAGVALQVLSAVPQVPMVEDAAAAGDAARRLNDIYAEVVAAHPDRFIAYGALALPHVDESLDQIRYCLDDLGFAGLAATTVIADGISPADERFDPVYAELDRRGAILYFHPTGGGAGCSLITDHGLEWVNGAPLEDSIALLHLMKADVPRRFPNIRFHIAHLGGDLPFLAQRVEDNYEDWGAFKASPIEMMRGMWLDAANFHAPSLRLVLDTLGTERVMVGSDYPYFQDEKYTRAVEYVRGAGLEDSVTDAVLAANAQRLYGDSLPEALRA